MFPASIVRFEVEALFEKVFMLPPVRMMVPRVLDPVMFPASVCAEDDAMKSVPASFEKPPLIQKLPATVSFIGGVTVAPVPMVKLVVEALLYMVLRLAPRKVR